VSGFEAIQSNIVPHHYSNTQHPQAQTVFLKHSLDIAMHYCLVWQYAHAEVVRQRHCLRATNTPNHLTPPRLAPCAVLLKSPASPSPSTDKGKAFPDLTPAPAAWGAAFCAQVCPHLARNSSSSSSSFNASKPLRVGLIAGGKRQAPPDQLSLGERACHIPEAWPTVQRRPGQGPRTIKSRQKPLFLL
jgi:hypothetical protein